MERSTRNASRLIATILFAFVICADLPTAAAQMQQRTVQAFDHYVQQAEARMDQQIKAGRPFLWVDTQNDAERNASYARLRNGEVLIQKLAAGDDLPGGLVHDWTALAFVPGATLAQTLAQLQDYNNDYKMYAPEVLRSKLLQRKDNQFSVLLRIQKKSFVTVVLDINNDVHYFGLDRTRAYSKSYSTRIVEVEDAGTPQEHERPVGDDHGYLWRLYTYWRFWQQDGGTYIQCEAIALTRGIPFGFAWLVKPYVAKIPKESLVFTLTKARDAIREEATRSSALRVGSRN